MDWTEGYRTEVNYTYGYYKEMNPCMMRFALLMAGFVPPDVSEACELGYGQGLSINIHAATENIAWTGTDFNPEQAAFAQELARASNARVECLADSFHAFCNRADLPEFDFIALHGIWSWISPENRKDIIGLVDSHLRIGGCLYLSYNANPGWAAFRPARDLMKFYLDTQEAQGKGLLNKVADSFDFMDRLLQLEPRYLKQNPQVQSRLQSFRNSDSAYLAHEFLNDVWEPSNFADIAKVLSEARLSYAGPAAPVRYLSALGLDEKQRAFLSEIQNPVLQETVRDFLLNTQFRKDYWLKGARRVGPARQQDLLRKESFVLLVPVDAVSREIKTGVGNLALSEPSYQVITSLMADGKPHSLAEIEIGTRELAKRPDAPANAGHENLITLAQAMSVLIDAGLAAPVQKKQDIGTARPHSDKLNAYIEMLATDNLALSYLGSPLTGGGIHVNLFNMLFLTAMRNGAKNAEMLAAFALESTTLAGRQIVNDGEPIVDREKALAYLGQLAETFIQKQLPVLKNLMAA